MSKKFCLLLAIGAVLSFLMVSGVEPLSGVALAAQYRFKPPVNLGPPINTTFNERDPFITADGLKLFFCSDVGGQGDLDIWVSSWNGTNWSTPVNLGPNINSGLNEWSPSVSPDGLKLYFLAYGRPGGQGGWDVWMSEYDSALQQWGTAQNLGPVINTFATDWSPTLSYDGQSLYYATNGYLHPQGQALYVSRWNGSSWETPQALPNNLNNTGTEESPALPADETAMFFVRYLVSYNGPAICVAQKDSVGSWSEPVVLDSFINLPNPSNGTDPAITPDGQKLYFVSGRSGGVGSPGGGDIWVAERIIIGDLNVDGCFSPADVVLELNKVFLGMPFPAPVERGDMNCDGQFAPADVVLMLNWIYLETWTVCS